MRKVFWLRIGLLISLFVAGYCSAAICQERPILIGATVSLEGKYAEPSKMIKEAFQLWAAQVNEKGGINGRQVRLILYDDKSDAGLTADLYKKLISEDKVDLVFSPYGTPLTLVASEISERHKYTMLACAAAGNAVWERGYRYIFGMYAPADRMFIGLLDMMAQKGRDTLAVIYDDASSFNRDVAAGVTKWARQLRIKILYRKGYYSGPQDLPDIVTELQAAKADGLIVSAYSPDCHALLRLFRENGYKPGVLGITIAPIHPDFLKKAGAIGDHVFAPSQWEPDERIPFPGTRRFIAAFQAFTGHLPSYHAGSAYAACQLYERAIRQAGSLDKDKIRNYIAALDTVTVIGRFKVDPTGKQIGHNAFIIQWQGGKKQIVWPTKMRTAEPIF